MVRANTREQLEEIRRQEAIAARLRDLQILGEQILAAVVCDMPHANDDPLEIPDYLRRY